VSERRSGWIGGHNENVEDVDRRAHEQKQIIASHNATIERRARYERESGWYWELREVLWELKLDVGKMATAEEKNGNYKTADVLRDVQKRIQAAIDRRERP
jgi:hypothetical protein